MQVCVAAGPRPPHGTDGVCIGSTPQ
jgi:hypothetical protein